MTIDPIAISDDVLDKIESKHGVSFDEVQDVCMSRTAQLRRGTRRLIQVYGQHRPDDICSSSWRGGGA